MKIATICFQFAAKHLENSIKSERGQRMNMYVVTVSGHFW